MIDRIFGRIGAAAAIAISLSFQISVASGQQPAALPVLPAPIIAVIDFKLAVEASTAGRSVIRQINERHALIQKKIANETALLETDKRQLDQQRAVLAPDIFKQRLREFQIRVQKYRRDIQGEQKKLDLMLGQSILKVEAELAKILRDMAREMGANIVVDAGPNRGNILFSDSDLVVTTQATERLNKVMPDITVVEPVLNQRSTQQTPRLKVPKVQ